MVRFPNRRLVPYVVAAVVVVAVGAWTVGRSGGNEGDAVEFSALGGAGGSLPTLSAGSPAGAATGDVAVGVGAGPTTTTSSAIFVQVAGKVARPGVYEVPVGSRVFEVLARAGGVTADGDEEALPLAAVLTDGARVIVPQRGSTAADGGEGAPPGPGALVQGATQSGQGGPDRPLSVSSATAAQLEELPGIGPSLAGQIVAFREAHGPFQSVDDLDEVPGIGPAILSRLRDLVVP